MLRPLVCEHSVQTSEQKLLWVRHEKSPEVDGRDGKVKVRMRTVLMLNTTAVSHIQAHFKSPTCCVFVRVTIDW
jgi:hypothetical protein